MNTYYTLLNIDARATPEAIATAYAHQRERYNPDRVAALDEEMRRLAEQRITELEHAYAVLSDPQRRQQYDAELSKTSIPEEMTVPSSSQPLSARDRWFIVGGGAIALVVVLAIWLATGQSQAGRVAAPTVNRPAPAFALSSPAGDTIQLQDYRGKIVMVNFWGTWCEPCIRELPELQTAYEQLQDQGFVIIGINLFQDEKAQNRTQEDIQRFVEQYGITYPIALDADGATTDSYHIYPIPTSFFIDEQGNIRYILPSELTTEKITELFHSLKRQSSAMYE